MKKRKNAQRIVMDMVNASVVSVHADTATLVMTAVS